MAGFSLIEVLCVMGVVALLMGMVVAMGRAAKVRSGIGRAKAELAVIAQALEDYRRFYGDYPQTGSATQAAAVVTTSITTAQAQSLLFNALTGVYGPGNFTTRLNGPSFIDTSKLTPENTISTSTFGIPSGTPPVKTAVANCFLDPWGNRYLYYYKPASVQGSTTTSSSWRAPTYVLYSLGPDGLQATGFNASTGLFTSGTQTNGNNADNLYADKLQ